MPYIKLLTVLAGLTLMTACAGGVNINNTNVPVNCETNAFHVDCNAIASAITLRETMCLADADINPTCAGEEGIVTVFCKANPFDTATPCVHEDYDDERQTMCLGNANINPTCGVVIMGVCQATPFNTACDADSYANRRVEYIAECGVAGKDRMYRRCWCGLHG